MGKFLLCSVMVLVMVATGIAKPTNRDTEIQNEEYARYAAMTPDELDAELVKLHKQLDENEAALKEYEVQERKHNLRMKHEKFMQEKMNKDNSWDQPADSQNEVDDGNMQQEDPTDESYMQQEDPTEGYKSQEQQEDPTEGYKSQEQQEDPTDESYMQQDPTDESYMQQDPTDESYMQKEDPTDDGFKSQKQQEDPTEGMQQDKLSDDNYVSEMEQQLNQANSNHRGATNDDKYEGIPQEQEEDPAAFAKRVREWDEVESLDHEDDDVHVMDEDVDNEWEQ